jgi:2-polyprenyl-3-methyl-5-hydroxy-6-metoxy-1,4-benzoquinol methylase
MGERSQDDFDLKSSRAYWRFAPSGAGKHDTSLLLNLTDAEVTGDWDDAFKQRFLRYPEEDEFLRQMSHEFAGKRVLSIGSGLGLHEIYYQLHGAQVTCCDIVASNLSVIERVAAAKGAAGMHFIVSSGPDHDLRGPYDIVFIYGSLMTMPQTLQRKLIGRCIASLASEGSIILMLYTWEFARATCGWSSPDEFDASAFARVSDPSVGGEHCPWSDWHDGDKLSELTAGTMFITRRQLWNQGWFVWYELRRNPVSQPSRFFDPARLCAHIWTYEIELSELTTANATAQIRQDALAVETTRNSTDYALLSGQFRPGTESFAANAILVDVDLDQGGLSIGLLEAEKSTFSFSQAVWQQGRHQHVFAFDCVDTQFKLIISNYRPVDPGISRFVLHRLAVLQRPTLEATNDPPASQPVKIRFPACLRDEYPQDFDAAWAATETVMDSLPGSDFAPLARHCPGLANYDWSSYIRLSTIRMVRMGAALREARLRTGKILDFGSYFGNFALFARRLGFEVDAADQYTSYGKAFNKVLPILRSAGIGIFDLGHGGSSNLSQIPEGSYDAVLFLGVIEHIPHSPKPLLLALNRVLRPGGTLIIDTPNLLYLYTREKLASGKPIAFPIQLQFDVELPFEGHHREYTSEEVVWMLQQIGHQDIHVELFNFSVYGLAELHGADAERFWRMEREPQLRELILTRSKKPQSAAINAETS